MWETRNDLLSFGDGNTAGNLESKSWMVGSLVLLKISSDRTDMLLNCKHKSVEFYLVILASSLSTGFICFCLIIKATFCKILCWILSLAKLILTPDYHDRCLNFMYSRIKTRVSRFWRAFGTPACLQCCQVRTLNLRNLCFSSLVGDFFCQFSAFQCQAKRRKMSATRS